MKHTELIEIFKVGKKEIFFIVKKYFHTNSSHYQVVKRNAVLFYRHTYRLFKIQLTGDTFSRRVPSFYILGLHSFLDIAPEPG